jgi:hypothetical protein
MLPRYYCDSCKDPITAPAMSAMSATSGNRTDDPKAQLRLLLPTQSPTAFGNKSP